MVNGPLGEGPGNGNGPPGEGPGNGNGPPGDGDDDESDEENESDEEDENEEGDGESLDTGGDREVGFDLLRLDGDGLPGVYEHSVTETDPFDPDSDSNT
jgi:hypothetical protein